MEFRAVNVHCAGEERWKYMIKCKLHNVEDESEDVADLEDNDQDDDRNDDGDWLSEGRG